MHFRRTYFYNNILPTKLHEVPKDSKYCSFSQNLAFSKQSQEVKGHAHLTFTEVDVLTPYRTSFQIIF